MTGLSMTPIVAGGITTLEPSHPGHQIRPRCFQQPMVMITHQHVGMNFPASALTKLPYRLQETHPIGIILKDVLAPVSPTHHMVSRALELNPYLPGHPRILAAQLSKCK